MDRHPIPTHASAIIQLGAHVHNTVHRMQQAEPCYRRLDELAGQLRAMGFDITTQPPHYPLADITPSLIASAVDDKLLQAIASTGHSTWKAGDHWQIYPVNRADEFALNFRLWEKP